MGAEITPQKVQDCFKCKYAIQDTNWILCKKANIFMTIEKAKIECHAKENKKDRITFEEAMRQMEKNKDWDSTEYVIKLIELNKEYKEREDKGETITELEQNVRDILMRLVLIDKIFEIKIKRLSKRCN